MEGEMTIGYAIKCLELMGHEVFKPKRARKWHVNFVDIWGTNTFTDEGLITKAIEQLTKREDVVDIAVSWLRDRQELQNVNGGNDCDFFLYAIELGIAPEQLLGVEG